MGLNKEYRDAEGVAEVRSDSVGSGCTKGSFDTIEEEMVEKGVVTDREGEVEEGVDTDSEGEVEEGVGINREGEAEGGKEKVKDKGLDIGGALQ